MKAVDLLLSEIVPPEDYQPGELLDKKGYNALATRLARRPERYAPVMKQLSDLGRESAYFRGESISLDDLRSPVDKPAMLAQLDAAIASARKASKSDDDFKQQREVIWDKFLTELDKEVMTQSVAKRNNLGRSVASGARGNALQLRAMIATPGLYTDFKGRTIPIFSRKSYGEGLRPAHYLASTYGVRSAILSTKIATAKGGDFSKLLNQAAADQVITEKDCGTSNGLNFAPDDSELLGRTLSRPTAGYEAGTPVDRQVLKALREAKVKTVLARSPITCTSERGLCSRCQGLLTNGTFAPIGYSAGVAAAQAIGEPVTQSALNCLAEGTLVRMADNSTKAIETLTVGEWVLGANLNGCCLPVQVTCVFDQGEQSVRTYLFRSLQFPTGVEVIGTKAHRVLAPTSEGPNHKLPLSVCAALCLQNETTAEFVQESEERQAHCWDIEVGHPDHLFVLASGAIVENSKHTSGAAKGGKKKFAGFEVLNALVQAPDTFPHKAAAATLAGQVDSVEPAPQGGTIITISGQPHYALPGYDSLVKPGDQVEAGDALSDGVLDVGDVVQHRGLGEGRRYYVDRLQQAIQDSGMAKPMKMNLEVIARAALDHVRVEDPDGYGDALPDDFISYNRMVRKHEPQRTAVRKPVGQAAGLYLQTPALHYTIGTKLTPRMVKTLKENDFAEVDVDETPPPFVPEMIRLRTAAHAGTDWLAKLNTSYLGTNLQNDAERGHTTDLKHNIHFAPRLAVGKDFGKSIGDKGEF